MIPRNSRDLEVLSVGFTTARRGRDIVCCASGLGSAAVNACAVLLWKNLLVDGRQDSAFFAEFAVSSQSQVKQVGQQSNGDETLSLIKEPTTATELQRQQANTSPAVSHTTTGELEEIACCISRQWLGHNSVCFTI